MSAQYIAWRSSSLWLEALPHTSKLRPTDLQIYLPIVFLYTDLPAVLQTVGPSGKC